MRLCSEPCARETAISDDRNDVFVCTMAGGASVCFDRAAVCQKRVCVRRHHKPIWDVCTWCRCSGQTARAALPHRVRLATAAASACVRYRWAPFPPCCAVRAGAVPPLCRCAECLKCSRAGVRGGGWTAPLHAGDERGRCMQTPG